MDNSNIFLAVKAAIVGVFGAFGAAFGWLGWLVLAWVACMAVDWLSGSSAAMQAGQWSSARARGGIWHKAGMIEDDDEVSEVTSDTERKIGFQPNEE